MNSSKKYPLNDLLFAALNGTSGTVSTLTIPLFDPVGIPTAPHPTTSHTPKLKLAIPTDFTLPKFKIAIPTALNLSQLWKKPLNTHHISMILRQLALMLQSGVPLSKALDILCRQEEEPRIQFALKSITNEVVNHGISLPDACAKYPEIFPENVILLIKTGHTCGNMANRLNEGANLLEREHCFNAGIKQAISGPIFTTTVCLLLVFGLIKFIMPRFLELYTGLHIPFPLLSSIVIFAVHVISHPLTFFAALFLGILYYKKHKEIRETLFHWGMEIPMVKNLIGKILGKQWCDTVAYLYKSGVPIGKTFDLLAETCTSSTHAENLRSAANELAASGSLSSAISHLPYFPVAIRQMLIIGESSGKIDHLLLAISRFMDEDIQVSLSRTLALIEPAAIITLGGIMSAIYIGLFLPIYSLASSMGM